MNTCTNCSKEFNPKRKDAKYCSNACKNEYHRSKNKKETIEVSENLEENEVSHTVPFSKEVGQNGTLTGQPDSLLKEKHNQLELEIKEGYEKIEKLNQFINRIPEMMERIELEVTIKQEEIKQQQEVVDMDDLEFYNLCLNQRYIEEQEKPPCFHFYKLNILLNSMEEYKEVQEMKSIITNDINVSKRFLNGSLIRLKRLDTDKKRFIDILKSTNTRLEHSNKRLIELDKRLFHQEKIEKVQIQKPIPKQKNTMGAGDLLEMNFETFQLAGELGRFLGELDKNMTAFALTGDSGAGKSYFSFQLAKAFADEGFSVKYFSLEEGIGRLTQQKIIKYNIHNEIAITGKGELTDVRRDAKLYDVIVLDSFSKLNCKADQFEKLRNDFPKTIFVMIFQKTTSGAIRGGSSILFNSSATIDVHFKDDIRVAEMKKGRYGTMGWVYDIEGGCVL